MVEDVLILTFNIIVGHAHSACAHFTSEGLVLKSGCKKKHFITALTPGIRGRVGGV